MKQQALNSDNQTFDFLAPRAGVLSGLQVKLAYTNGATGGGGQDIADIVSKIQVVGNGSDILFSLSGYELLKWAYKWQKDRAVQLRDAQPNDVQYCTFPVLFGRYLGDKDYWINLADYNTLDIQITYAPTISATQFATLTGVLDIIGVFWPTGVGVPARKGWLRTTQINKFTTVAAGENVQILSNRYPYAGLMVYAFKQGDVEGADITTVELRLDGGTYIPITGRWVDLQEENDVAVINEPIEEMITFAGDNTAIETRSGRLLSAQSELVFPDAADALVPIFRIRSMSGSQITTAQVSAAGSTVTGGGAVDATKRPVLWRSRGVGIGHAVFVPLTRNDDFDMPFDAPAHQDIRLALVQGGAGADVRVSAWEIVAA
ncbi:MAG: hypothetical protein IVW53_15455 [Chloroflexi bacterium]|nr:hypothetical protein [Chloroflexota bacterium]